MHSPRTEPEPSTLFGWHEPSAITLASVKAPLHAPGVVKERRLYVVPSQKSAQAAPSSSTVHRAEASVVATVPLPVSLVPEQSADAYWVCRIVAYTIGLAKSQL